MPDPTESAGSRENDRFNNAIAILVALISAFLAVSNVKNGNIVQAIQRSQALLTDSWNQYQAKRMRQFELDLEVKRGDALIRDGILKDTPENRSLREGWLKEIERYRTELKELTDVANGHQAEFKRLNDADDLFDFSGKLPVARARAACGRGADAHCLAARPRRRRRACRLRLRARRLHGLRRLEARLADGAPGRLKHDPEKWLPVFGEDHAQTKR
jgi:hypothetical protein